MTIQAPGEPLLDNESTRGDERVSGRRAWVGLLMWHGGTALDPSGERG